MENLVSVVMPTYNREFNDIKSSIETVLSQTYKNIEVIIVDDNGIGSDIQKNNQIAVDAIDNTHKITYLSNKKNSGAQYSRNQGILAARGEFVAFIDDDDLWCEDKIEKQIKLFEDAEVGLVYSKGWIVDNDKLNVCGGGTLKSLILIHIIFLRMLILMICFVATI